MAQKSGSAYFILLAPLFSLIKKIIDFASPQMTVAAAVLVI